MEFLARLIVTLLAGGCASLPAEPLRLSSASVYRSRSVVAALTILMRASPAARVLWQSIRHLRCAAVRLTVIESLGGAPSEMRSQHAARWQDYLPLVARLPRSPGFADLGLDRTRQLAQPTDHSQPHAAASADAWRRLRLKQSTCMLAQRRACTEPGIARYPRIRAAHRQCNAPDRITRSLAASADARMNFGMETHNVYEPLCPCGDQPIASGADGRRSGCRTGRARHASAVYSLALYCYSSNARMTALCDAMLNCNPVLVVFTP